MKKRKRPKGQMVQEKRTYALFLIVVGLILVFAAMFFCTQNVEKSLKKEMENTLGDIAGQSALAVRKEITGKYRLLSGIARELQDNPERKDMVLQEMNAFVESYEFKRMGYVSQDGTGHTTDGYNVNLASRQFFQKSMEGKVWLTSTIEDTIGDPDRINVFSVPVYNQDNTEIVGAVFATYRNENFQNLTNVDFFASRGFTCIINNVGNVISHSLNSPMQGEDNFFEVMDGLGGDDAAYVQQMREKMAAGETGIGMYSGSDSYYPMMYYYMPLYGKGYDSQWYIVSIVPQSVIAEHIAPIRQHVDMLTVVLLLIALVGMGIYIYYEDRYKKELTSLAYHDNVTGGYNFACFKEAAKRRKGVCGYLVAMDLYDFKTINISRGVQVGDDTLKELWNIILANLKEGEIAARVNADRFILFLDDDEKEVFEQRICKIIQEINLLSDKLNIPKVFPVFGIYRTNRVDETDKCYGLAVQAKRLVKGRRDRHFAYYDEIDTEKVLETKRLENSFEEALSAGQFEVWYQPKYSTQDRVPIGAEALVRWRMPDGRIISPGIFIPLFEKNGNITKLDEYIFRAVCKQQKAWLEEGMPIVPVSVNISRVSLFFSNIVEKYFEIINTCELDPKYIQLEITESAMIDNDNMAFLIEDFHDKGFAVLLDDFGSGYSSLSSLNKMHFDTMKLDKSLIDYIGDENGEKLLKHITMLGQSLGLHITAEGVETQKQLDFLRNLDCDDIQGYFFSKPLPREEYTEIVHRLGIYNA